MKRQILLIFLILAGSLGTNAKRVAPYAGSRIFWDLETMTTVFKNGIYGRIIQLQDNRLIAVCESGGICISFSNDKGLTWSIPKRILNNPKGINLAVPDLAQLKDGTILIGYNPRPSAPYSEERKFGIRAIRSTDLGETWSEPIFVYDASYKDIDGCWEPFFLEMPTGEVQCYFSNEAYFTNSKEQCIVISRSFDRGQTWGKPEPISFRAGSRDGMPSAIILKDSSHIVMTIEDNGWPGRKDFLTTTVRCPLETNWENFCVDGKSEFRDKVFAKMPPKAYKSAAPYIRMLPWGETVVSFQGNEGRKDGSIDMFVLVGDEQARNFKAQTRPFRSIGKDEAMWNSLAVIDTGQVVAVTSCCKPGKGTSIKMIKGYPIKEAIARHSTIKVDGSANDEGWTFPHARQLYMGTVTRNWSTVDFAYDDKNLYLISHITDRFLVKNGKEIDGMNFYIDADNVSDTRPVKGMFRFFFGADGSLKMWRADKKKWIAVSGSIPIYNKVKVQEKKHTYCLEAAIPWTLLGKKEAPVGNRMAIAIEIVDKQEKATLIDTIADVDTDNSSTWLQFRLI